MIITVTHDAIKALLLIAPKSDIRYYLNGVCVDVRNGAVTLVATDGHRLLAVPVAADNVEGASDGQYIISRDVLDAVKPCKYGKNSLPIAITIDQPATYQDEHGRTHQPPIAVTITGATTATSPTTDGRFPDWRRVTPTSANNEPAQYQPEYIASFGKIGELFGGQNVKCVIHYNGYGAALVTFPTSEAIGVVMPIRVDGEGKHPGLPSWARMSD